MTDYRVCFITHPEIEGARKLAGQLLERHLVACVNIVPKVESLYWWEGKVQNDVECLLILKTHQDKVDSLIEQAQQLHPYSVPEVLLLPVAAGNDSYLSWLSEHTVGQS